MGKFLVASVALLITACTPSSGVFADYECVGTGTMRESGAPFCLARDGSIAMHFDKQGVVWHFPRRCSDSQDRSDPTTAIVPSDSMK